MRTIRHGYSEAKAALQRLLEGWPPTCRVTILGPLIEIFES